MTQAQFLKRLEGAEKAMQLLERRRAFFASSERKVDFSRLNEAEMGTLDVYLYNDNFKVSGLCLKQIITLEEIFEKAAGIRDSIDASLDYISSKAGFKWCKFRIHHGSAAAPWEKVAYHGRFLPLLEEAVRSDPVLNPPPPPPPPPPTEEERRRRIEINTAQLEWELDPTEEKKQIWLALVAEDKRIRSATGKES